MRPGCTRGGAAVVWGRWGRRWAGPALALKGRAPLASPWSPGAAQGQGFGEGREQLAGAAGVRRGCAEGSHQATATGRSTRLTGSEPPEEKLLSFHVREAATSTAGLGARGPDCGALGSALTGLKCHQRLGLKVTHPAGPRAFPHRTFQYIPDRASQETAK